MNIMVGPYYYYFSTGAGNNAPGESAYYSWGRFRGFNPYDATHLDIYFESAKDCNAVDTVRLTITSGKHKEISVILLNQVAFSNAHPSEVSIITVYDGDTGLTINNMVTGVAITYGSACSGGGSGSMSNWTIRDDDDDDVQIDNAEFLKVTMANGTAGTNLSGSGTTGSPYILALTSPGDTTYSAATSSALGLVKLEDDTEQSVAANTVTAIASRTYGVQLNSSDQAVVNIPWKAVFNEEIAGWAGATTSNSNYHHRSPTSILNWSTHTTDPTSFSAFNATTPFFISYYGGLITQVNIQGLSSTTDPFRFYIYKAAASENEVNVSLTQIYVSAQITPTSASKSWAFSGVASAAISKNDRLYMFWKKDSGSSSTACYFSISVGGEYVYP